MEKKDEIPVTNDALKDGELKSISEEEAKDANAETGPPKAGEAATDVSETEPATVSFTQAFADQMASLINKARTDAGLPEAVHKTIADDSVLKVTTRLS